MPMQMNMAQARSYVANLLDIDVQTGDGATNVLAALNAGGLRVWESRPWIAGPNGGGRDVETVLSTVAPYVTGTFAITQGLTALVGTGTTWTAAMSGRKFAKGIGQNWYRFTRTGNTTGTTAEAYAEATETASAHAIFQDELDLPTTAESITSVQIIQPYFDMVQSTQAKMDEHYYVNFRSGVPRVWGPTQSQTTGVRRIRVSPVPDAVYRIRVRYVAAWTDLVGPNDICVLGLNRQRAWLLASTLEAQRLGDVKQVTTDAEVEAAISQAWTKDQAASTVSVRKVPVGARRAGYFFTGDPPMSGF